VVEEGRGAVAGWLEVEKKRQRKEVFRAKIKSFSRAVVLASVRRSLCSLLLLLHITINIHNQ
jgi:hypothetical protein